MKELFIVKRNGEFFKAFSTKRKAEACIRVEKELIGGSYTILETEVL
jgi:hypothetical protein